MGSVRLERARDRTDRAHRRVLALTFGPDFIHWRRSGESWPIVGPGRRLFFLMNSPAALAAWPRSAMGSRRLERARDSAHRACLWRVCALAFQAGCISGWVIGLLIRGRAGAERRAAKEGKQGDC